MNVDLEWQSFSFLDAVIVKKEPIEVEMIDVYNGENIEPLTGKLVRKRQLVKKQKYEQEI